MSTQGLICMIEITLACVAVKTEYNITEIFNNYIIGITCTCSTL